ncbi:MAG: permease, partial [Gammaproteobacteria bacterium]|nr:permease [Gammaproteobacteria bacterium]
MTYFDNFLHLSLEAAPWLLLGFVAAGLIKAWIPAGLLNRWLGGSGLWPVTKAALIGAPLPLCSCGVLPAALGLHRSGASKGSTVSFLISTPETGVDSVALSYVMLGPVMAVIRPVAAVLSAIATGLLAGQVADRAARREAESKPSMAPSASCTTGECRSCGPKIEVKLSLASDCCADGGCSSQPPAQRPLAKARQGLSYALVEMV